MGQIENDWLVALKSEFKESYYRDLFNFVNEEYKKHTIYPPKDDIFNAFHFTPLSKVKVVIIGQDPYHNVNQANGLCFSVPESQRDIPPSLKNIYKEIENEYGYKPPKHGCLTKWANEGVLMLNAVLTVRAHEANSHAGHGWEKFTDAAIRAVNKVDRPVVYMLWGNPARKKAAMLDNPKHLVLEAPHPSPLSCHRGFFGCNHFKLANDFLEKNGETPIDWRIE